MLRLILALPLAIAITLALFMLMAALVEQGPSGPQTTNYSQPIDVVMLEQDSEVQRRQRRLPEPPVPQPPLPSSTPLSSVNSAAPVIPDMPQLDFAMADSGIAVSLPDIGMINSDQQAMPLYRVEPRYPARAMKQGAEGMVELSFTIDTLGRPVDIKVIKAKPRRLFEKAATRALQKWKYQPKLVDGKAIAQVGQTVTLEFKLSR